MSDNLLSGLQSILGITEEQGIDAEERSRQERVVRRYFKRIRSARDAKKKWESNYEVDRCHDYVRGFQRAKEDELDAQGDRRYQINKILAGLKAKIPQIFYYHPYIRIRPSRGREDTPGQTVYKRAELLQDTINTIIRMPETRFKEECMVALKEAHWAFGVIEGGYSAQWGDNPFASKPPLVENEEAAEDMNHLNPDDEEEMALARLVEVPHSETFYVRHIPARQFFVSNNDRSSTDTQDWIGYWEWMYVSDVKGSKAFQNTQDLKPSASMDNTDLGSDMELSPLGGDGIEDDIPSDMVRVWKIWDQREKIRYVFAEGHELILREEQYTRVPLSILRLEVMPGEWYPIPPIFQQLTEQDEYNDAREWLRMVRKGTRPRYMYDKDAFDDEELDKLETDEFGVFVGVNGGQLNAIAPIQQPTFGDAALQTLGLAESGFAEQAASSPTARLTRGAGGAPTATEVQSMEQMGDVRSSYEQEEVAVWLADISNGLLRVAVEKATLPTWILINSDPYSEALLTDALEIFQVLQQIKNPIPEQMVPLVKALEQQFRQERGEVTPDDLEEAFGSGQWDVTVDIESMSPVSESQHAARIMQALNLISSPGPGELLALSPELLKSMLNMMGIRSAQDHKAIMIALQKKQMMQQMMQMMQMGGGSPPAEPGVAPMAGGDQPNIGAGGGPPEVSGPPEG